MSRKTKMEYVDYTHTTLDFDINKLDDAFTELKTQRTKDGGKYIYGEDTTVDEYKHSLYTIREICKKYPDNTQVVFMLQNNLYLVGARIHGMTDLEIVSVASDFMTDMADILTSGKFIPENQFRIAYGLGQAIDRSRYNIHTRLNGTFSEDKDTFTGIIMGRKNFPCMAAISGVLQCRFVEPDINKLNTSEVSIRGVFSAVRCNYDIDEYTRNTVMTMINEIYQRKHDNVIASACINGSQKVNS